jgi:two-component system, NtrC family, sensor kinase
MRINLKTKIWLTILTIVLMFSFFTFLYFPARQEEYLLKNYNNEVQNLAKTVAVGVEIAINEQNFKGIKKEIEIVKNDPRLSFVSLLEEDTVWTGKPGQYFIHDSIITSFPEKVSVPSEISSNGLLIVKRASLNTKLMNGNGAIMLGFKTAEITQIRDRMRKVSFLVSGVVCLIAILVGFWLSRNISKPIIALREAARLVGEGDLDQRVNKSTRDEIGDLTEAFNKMVEDLGKTRAELKQTNITLASTNTALKASMEDLKEAQDQLLQAEKMASLGQLTAGIAHEINNPINFVSANITPLKEDLADILLVLNCYDKIIEEKKLQADFIDAEKLKVETHFGTTVEEVRKLLTGIEDGARRTSEIVRGLRNFSRIDQNVFKKTNLNDCLESTLTLLHSSYKNRIEIVAKYGDIPEVDCFPGQINQVLMNILSNAIQSIPETGKIFINTRVRGDMVKISIKDTGGGMSEEVRKKIYDPFFTTKEVGKGTGLGLYISYGIIEKHNGKIEVFSNVGEGTEFVISIPITQQIPV